MKIQKCQKKSHHFLTLWPWPLTYDLEKLIRSGHYHYQCVYQIWEQSIPWFFSYRVNTIGGGGRQVTGGGRLRRKTITSPDPSDTGDIKIKLSKCKHQAITWTNVNSSLVRSSDSHLRAILQELPHPSITKISLKVTHIYIFFFFSNLPWANELIQDIQSSVWSAGWF